MFLSCHRRFLPPSIIVDSLSTLHSPNCLAHSRDYVAEYPHLQKLPTPVQALLADEITAAGDLIMASNELKELDDETHCDCEFFRRYQLPCRDIWA
ncbi:hypothetical protein HO173_010504 [Letharia columbiana]|uniref:Uncharacterized protein n=1 Tax=Letharia columbiana TaxID=112416 RepID=A0A8H6L0V8_9LECA|nr:uncharacterized protein HO173_010504 [Letharia columbiana]KAF6231361.1 hypothetical protein HO173_010504 [Letharia columbiana]